MSENGYKLEGFLFTDLNEYKEAKKEAESIEYIKANNDLEDYRQSLKIYHKMVEHNYLRTPVGHAFLKQLQDRIQKEGVVGSNSLPCIPVGKKKTASALFHFTEHNQTTKQPDMTTEYRLRLRNTRIVSLFLFGIIIIMIFMAVYSDRTKFTDYQNQIVNKYAAWEEDLSAREKALEEKEDLQSEN